MNNKFFIVNIPFLDWEEPLSKQNHLIIRKGQPFVKNILPIAIDDYLYKNSIFKNTIETIAILNNKSIFGKFMTTYFPESIPKVYYYHYYNGFYNESYISKEDIPLKLIQKPNIGFYGNGIILVNQINRNLREHIISEFIDHTIYYVGHFLIKDGKILEKIFFFSSDLEPNSIKKGSIINYTILDSLSIDDSIFSNIFSKLLYNGFACSDFTIVQNRIVIFEINPRPGGSLIHNKVYLSKFIETAYCLNFG